MTVAARADACTSAFIFDSLQSQAGHVTRAPENQSWIDWKSPPGEIHNTPLVNTLLIHNGAAITFAENRGAIETFAHS